MPVSIQDPSRRGFLRVSLALGAAAMLPRGLKAAAAPAAASAVAGSSDYLALLSDVHVSGGFFASMGEHLSVAVGQVLKLPQKPEKVLIAGDCAYLTGAGEDYREYVRRIQPMVTAGLPLHMTMGNHDNREHFWEALPKELSDANLKIRRQSTIVKGKQANWFMLDTLNKTNSGGGELGHDQLEWLTAELDAHTDKPALIMLHHDPLRNGKKASLTDSDKLLDISRPRKHVKAMFFGHTHVWDVAQDYSGIHLVNLPATGYTLWMKSFLGWVSCRVYKDGAAMNIHTIDPKRAEQGQVVRLKWRAG